MIDVAGGKESTRAVELCDRFKGVEIRVGVRRWTVRPGDIVLIRTGTLRYWGETGADHETLAKYDSAGITLEAAKWLVEQKGAVMVGADTSGLEVGSDPRFRIT